MFEKYDAYKDSGVEWIGDIPIHWDVKNLRYAFDFLNHRRIPLSALERGISKDVIHIMALAESLIM